MIIVYILAGLVALFVILALVAPKSATLEHGIMVNATPKQAFEHLRSLKNFDEWSPWSDRDPNMEKGFSGEDGEVGSISWWKGNKQVGEGEQELMKLFPISRIEMELRFLKPFKAVNSAWFRVENRDNGTQVYWGFKAKFKIPLNIMMLFMNVEKAIGKDYEAGLKRFKKHIEEKLASA